jgi:hypothetical protein
MATLFEELASLDRPIVDVQLTINGKVKDLTARRPNALEADAIESYYSDEYARLIIEKTESSDPARPSELDQMRGLYAGRTREELTAQLLETRLPDIERIAFEKADFDVHAEIRMFADRPESEREAYLEKRKAEVKKAQLEARAEVKAEYDARDFKDLVDLISQVNINVKAISEAQSSKASMYLYYALIDDKGERICPSAEAVKANFTMPTIRRLVSDIEKAFVLQSAPDLPFVSPDDNEPDGQPSSSATSEAGTVTGGKRTRTTRASSKRSTTPVGSTASKTP